VRSGKNKQASKEWQHHPISQENTGSKALNYVDAVQQDECVDQTKAKANDLSRKASIKEDG
jgi:hypothetical protein